MLNLLHLPAELFYEGGAEDGYESYMNYDATGINHVLDEMYGAVFHLEEADFEESTPSYYMDAAYQLAIAIKQQKYPHRFLRMSDVEKFLAAFSDSELCLSAWMAYALLRLRDDNSNDLEAFLVQFREYLEEETPYSHTSEIINRLQAIVEREEKNGTVCDVTLIPDAPQAELIRKLDFGGLDMVLNDDDMKFLLDHVVMHDFEAQQALLDKLKDAGKFDGDYERLSHLIGKGDFITFDEVFHPELPEASEEEQYVMRIECLNEMNLWKKKAEYYKAKCDCYEQKEKLAAVLDGAVQLGKGIDTHLEDMYEDLKKGAEEQKEALNDKIKELEKELKKAKQTIFELRQALDEEADDAHNYSLSPEAFETLRKNSGCDFTLTLDETDGGIHSQLSNRVPKILAEMWNSLIDPSIINSANYPGAKQMLEIVLDIKEVDEAIDDKDEKALSRNLRKVDRVRVQNEELYQNQKEIKRLKLASMQGAQNVTIINGNKVERSYGDNYNLEAGAKVEKPASLEGYTQLEEGSHIEMEK